MKNSAASNELSRNLFIYLQRLGDDRLILGQRLSEWCGHGPILEEDIAITNIALDLIGQASTFLRLAAQMEGKGRTEDDLAFLRDGMEFKNVKLVELPRGDFAFTIARQYLFDCFSVLFMQQLATSSQPDIAALAAKTLKEDTYHLRHSQQWVIRLGDGTEESKARVQQAIDELWMYTGELFEADEVDLSLTQACIAPDLKALQPLWRQQVLETFKEAQLKTPHENCYMASGSRKGFHTEHLGHLLAQMQVLPRSFPGAAW